MIKLIASDLDGTLFYPKNRFKALPSCNIKFLKKNLSDSLKLILVSGRNIQILPTVNKVLGVNCGIIGCNGAYYYDVKSGIKNPRPMNREKLLDLFCTLYNNYGAFIWFLFDDSDTLYLCSHELPKSINKSLIFGNKFSGVYKEKIIIGEKKFIEKITNSDNYKLMCAFGFGNVAKDKVYYTYLSCKDEYKDDFTFATSKNVLEITAKGVNKGIGLLNYCKNNNISPDEVFVCGDSGNDLYMFSAFPHSFCMSHSQELVKKEANHIIDRVSDLERYLSDPSLYKDDKIKNPGMYLGK